MRRYAADVLIAMGNWDGAADMAICPLTGLSFPITDGEVDKVNPESGYTPGNVILVSRIGNQERGKLQQWAGDIAGVERYAADVARVSMTVNVTRFCHLTARGIVPVAKGTDTTDAGQNNVRNGPYGTA